MVEINDKSMLRLEASRRRTQLPAYEIWGHRASILAGLPIPFIKPGLLARPDGQHGGVGDAG